MQAARSPTWALPVARRCAHPCSSVSSSAHRSRCHSWFKDIPAAQRNNLPPSFSDPTRQIAAGKICCSRETAVLLRLGGLRADRRRLRPPQTVAKTAIQKARGALMSCRFISCAGRPGGHGVDRAAVAQERSAVPLVLDRATRERPRAALASVMLSALQARSAMARAAALVASQAASPARKQI